MRPARWLEWCGAAAAVAVFLTFVPVRVHARLPAQAQSAPTTLEGVVTAAGTPVGGVRIRATAAVPSREEVPGGAAGSAPPGTSREVKTDAAGHFQFIDLPRGRYVLFITAPAGFVSQPPRRLVDLSEGPVTLALRVQRAGSISGRVLAATSGLAGAEVRLLRRGGLASIAGLEPVLAGSRILTNVDGQFHIVDAPPGEYYLVASYTVPRRPGDFDQRSGFVATYYPGSPLLREARPVVVRPGEETANIDVRLVRMKLGQVSGKAIDSAGNPLPNVPAASITLYPASDERAAAPTSVSAVRFGTRGGQPAEGMFLFPDVPPGNYRLVASLFTPQDPGNRQVPRVRTDDGRRFWDAESVEVPVSVTEGGRQVLNVRTNAGATVSGRVVIEGGQPGEPPDRPSGRPLTVRAASARPVTSPASTTVGGDGAFALSGVRGDVLLVGSGDGLALKSVSRAGHDVTAKLSHFDGTERAGDFLIVMTADTASVEGTVTTPAADDTVVVLFPEDSSRWVDVTLQPFVRVARVATSVAATGNAPTGGAATAALGRFSFKTLLPGRYLLAALLDTGGAVPADAASLADLRPAATAITLEAGRAATVSLTPVELVR